MHRFVKGSDNEKPIPNRLKHSIKIDDDQTACGTYEKILQMPSTSQPIQTSQINKSRKSIKRVIQPFDKNKLFQSATNNNVSTIEQMRVNKSNVNVTDQFGWTALMMASCAGHLDVCKVLIRLGANQNHSTNTNESALTLAKNGKHHDIVAFLTELSEPICLSSDDDNGTAEATSRQLSTFYCAICKATFPNRQLHETSTVHRFNRTPVRVSRHFAIPETNVGYRMLLQQGWNRESGLGPEQNGAMYPIKTTLRKPRSGLGIRQPATAKVTHFKAFDDSAVKSTKPPIIPNNPTKRQMRVDRLHSQRRDRHLRQLLS